MSIKARVGRYFLIFVVALMLISALGLASAYFGLAKCISATEKELSLSGLTSHNFDGDLITYRDIEVSGEVAYPFVVITRYRVPQGLHAEFHNHTYFVLFGYIKEYDYTTYSLM
jgi:hypothetical protein